MSIAGMPMPGIEKVGTILTNRIKNIVSPLLNSLNHGKIFFGQKSVSSIFSHGILEGKSIGEVAIALKQKTISPNLLPIDIIQRNGQIITLNNRSLLALKRAGLSPTIINDRTGNKFFEALLDKHLQGSLPHDYIRVRGGPLGTSIISP
jgi:hypothetical protein